MNGAVFRFTVTIKCQHHALPIHEKKNIFSAVYLTIIIKSSL